MKQYEFFDPAEFWTLDHIQAAQMVRLNGVVEKARRSRAYADKLQGIRESDLRMPEDIAKLPFTTKDDLRAGYPDGFLTLPQEKMVRLHASSGTTGSPTVVYHTQNDINAWADLMARSLFTAGVRSGDVLQNMSGYGLFTGGLGIHYGAERLGCLTIPAGAGNTKRQVKLIKDFGVTVLHIIPSYALYFVGWLEKYEIDPAELPVKIALIGAEPHTEEARKRIEEQLHVKAYNSYGLSEMNGPGVAFECKCQNGMHVWEDAFFLEIINPDTGEPVPEGEVGEVVMTTLTREGMPIIRYRTRDLSRIMPGDCPCGRAHRRLDRILGRADDMMIIKGVNIYPMQIEQVLMTLPEVGRNYQIILEREGPMDQIRIQVEVKEEFFVEDMRALGALQKKVSGMLRDEILVTPRVDLVESGSIPKAEGKAVRVVDNREEK
jgi:phenylacetate-CoA ligase